jgi:hypothetical protein
VQRGEALWTWDGAVSKPLMGRFPVRMVVAGYPQPHGKLGLVVVSPLEPTEAVGGPGARGRGVDAAAACCSWRGAHGCAHGACARHAPVPVRLQGGACLGHTAACTPPRAGGGVAEGGWRGEFRGRPKQGETPRRARARRWLRIGAAGSACGCQACACKAAPIHRNCWLLSWANGAPERRSHGEPSRGQRSHRRRPTAHPRCCPEGPAPARPVALPARACGPSAPVNPRRPNRAGALVVGGGDEGRVPGVAAGGARRPGGQAARAARRRAGHRGGSPGPAGKLAGRRDRRDSCEARRCSTLGGGKEEAASGEQ